jgi:hypothetical protein
MQRAISSLPVPLSPVISNRSVQIGHTTDQIGKPSAESAAGRFAGSTTARGRGFRAE